LTKNIDTFLAVPSDLHSGGSTALFPHYRDLQNGCWQFKHTRYTPSARQGELADHFDYCADEVKKARKGKRLIIVDNGDCIDGNHHATHQLATHNPAEQQDIHIFLMQRFMKRTGFDHSKGDLLYIVSGTETHTQEDEDYIARELNAEPNPKGGDLFDFLPLEINGKLFWFLHQGAGPGRGIAMGDSLRMWLKNKYWTLLEDGIRLPDMVISGHYHVPVYNEYIRPRHTMRGIICPSFQLPTRFVYKVAAGELSKVGLATVNISAAGAITANPFMIMRLKDETVKA
jgi:2',3'-cyclic-nucleotide 2'-phosphodiesterase (5'-nucleotidase family)